MTGIFVISVYAFWKVLRLGNAASDFLRVNFCSRDFFVVLFKAPGIFMGFEFCSHAIIPFT